LIYAVGSATEWFAPVPHRTGCRDPSRASFPSSTGRADRQPALGARQQTAHASPRGEHRREIAPKTAIIVPAILGSMPFFWFANVLALCSLPAVLTGFDNEVLKHALGLESFFPHVILAPDVFVPARDLEHAAITSVADLPALGVPGMEPTGIEPVTSCLHGGADCRGAVSHDRLTDAEFRACAAALAWR
jgi:hypothetical protein